MVKSATGKVMTRGQHLRERAAPRVSQRAIRSLSLSLPPSVVPRTTGEGLPRPLTAGLSPALGFDVTDRSVR